MQAKTFILTQKNRSLIIEWLENASDGVVVTFKKAKRTIPQNSRMWAMLTAIAEAKPYGREHIPEDWKVIFMRALGIEVYFLHGLDGEPFPAGFRSSHLNKDQLTALMDLIQAFANDHKINLEGINK